MNHISIRSVYIWMNLFTPWYSWNIAKVGVKHQSINQYIWIGSELLRKLSNWSMLETKYSHCLLFNLGWRYKKNFQTYSVVHSAILNRCLKKTCKLSTSLTIIFNSFYLKVNTTYKFRFYFLTVLTWRYVQHTISNFKFLTVFNLKMHTMEFSFFKSFNLKMCTTYKFKF